MNTGSFPKPVGFVGEFITIAIYWPMLFYSCIYCHHYSIGISICTRYNQPLLCFFTSLDVPSGKWAKCPSLMKFSFQWKPSQYPDCYSWFLEPVIQSCCQIIMASLSHISWERFLVLHNLFCIFYNECWLIFKLLNLFHKHFEAIHIF